MIISRRISARTLIARLVGVGMCVAAVCASAESTTVFTPRGQLAHKTFHALQHERVARVFFKNVPLATALEELAQLPGWGGGTILSLASNNVRVTVAPALTNVSLEQALAAIKAGADQSIHYQVTHKGKIQFRNCPPEIRGRSFLIRTASFQEELKEKGFTVEAREHAVAFSRFQHLLTEGDVYTVWLVKPSLDQYFVDNGIDLKGNEVRVFPGKDLLTVAADAPTLHKIAALLEPFIYAEGSVEAQSIDLTEEGKILLAEGKLGEAEEKLKQALRLFPGNTNCHNLITAVQQRKALASVARNQSAHPVLTAEEPGELFTHTYVSDPKVSVDALLKWAETVQSLPANEPPRPDEQSIAADFPLIPIQTATQALRAYLADEGIDIAPPKSLFFNTRTGAILIRGTSDDLHRAVPAIDKLIKAPQSSPLPVLPPGSNRP